MKEGIRFMKQKFFDHEEQRYSIRKYAFGAASVLIGSVLFMTGPVAKAEDITTSSDSSTIATQVVNTDETSSTTAEETSPVATMNTAQSTSEVVVASTTATTSESTVEATTSEVVTSETATSELDTETVTSEMASADVTSEVVTQSVTTTAQTASSEVSSNETTTTSEVAAYTTREVSETSDVIVVDPQIEKVTGAVTTSTNGAKDIPSSGRYTYTERTEVKNTPSVSANVAFYANAGDSVNYDKVLTNDGYQWISYNSYSGTRRYAAITKLTETKRETPSTEKKLTGNVSIENLNHTGFDVLIKNASDTNGLIAVKVPVWTSKSDQDDIIWYDAKRQNDGLFKVSVATSDHKNETGKYNVHVYYTESNGKLQGVSAQTVTVPEASKGTQNIPSSGYYTFTKEVEVKNEPKMSAPTQFTFEKGFKLNLYDKVLEADNHQWISYVSYSGTRRYIPIATLTNEETHTGTVSFNDKANGDFDVILSNVQDSNGISAVKVPVWTENANQDDIIWYDGQKQSDGTYKVSVKLSDHKNERGKYNVHVYYAEPSGKLQGVAATNHTVAEVTTTTNNATSTLPNQGKYTFTERTEVKNEAKVSSPTQFYFNKGDSVNYDKALVNDGRQWISYISYSGTRRYANVGAVNTNAPVTTKKVEAKQTGTINIENKTSNGFDVVVTNVSSTTPIAEVKVPVWSTQGDQDDITWNTATKQSDGSYKTSVKVSDHKSNYGDYNIHLYYALTDGKFVGVAATKTTVEAPKTDVRTGNISVENKTSQGFDVVISNVSAVSGVQKVVVPIWSTQGGQDDIIWYDATNQNNGTYKVNVKVSDHKNNYGEYNIHLYYTQNDGKFEGVAATTTTLEQPKEAQKASISYNGSYYHVQGKYDDILIVNKKYPLSSNYNPGENSTAKEAFVRMRNDMINQGYNVGYGYSGFRSYNTQSGLYQSYVNRDGQEAADRYSARPGYSEHQTGLSYDLTDKSGNLLEDAAASNWLKNNAHNYGFIVRYQPGKEASTGFMEEAWHVRYIGKEAKEIHDSGLSLEEYFGIQGGGYSSSSTGIPTTTIPSIPSQGRYTFTKRLSIKSEPKKSSAELAYYDAGQSVNYDKVLDSDGARWISYVAYSGARRYIAIS